MTRGEHLFARYAFAPNHLGYCGPAETAALFELGVTGRSDVDIASIARRFSGAWPYAALLAEVAGIDDPLDEQVMRAYWTGGVLLDGIDRESFGIKLLALIESRTGGYWTHLTSDLLPEVTATHGFHVFGVYPWSRMLTGDLPEQSLEVLDNCRIRWGQVVAVDEEHVIVRSRRLTWDGTRLALGAEAPERVRLSIAGRAFVADPSPGDWLALHWDWACDRLSVDDSERLAKSTDWQLQATNRRLARG